MKNYTIIINRPGSIGSSSSSREVTGDLTYLLQYFSYTLECGASWNRKINRYPKTIKSFISNLQKSYEEKEASCYNRTHVELKTEQSTVNSL
jgi:hypothetical protein